MRKLVVCAIAALGPWIGAQADIWTWVDDEGKTRYVDTNRPIWYWRDTTGQIYYSDRPEHENAIRVALTWHSDGNLAGSGQAPAEEAEEAEGSDLDPEESREETRQREIAEAYYCNEAREIYDTYAKAPRLFRTLDSGEREYLTVQEMAVEIAKAEEQVGRLCG